jgi:ribonuclease Z
MLDLCLLGTGGMMPLPKRWLTSLMTRYNGSSLLIDCGEGTQLAIKECGWSFNPIDTICFTHYHADHISGLPGLLLTMGNADRTKPVTMIGPKGLEKVVNSLRVIAPELPFKINFIELNEDIQTIHINGYEIEAFKVHHKIVCYGYNIKINRQGKFQVDKAVENGIPKEYWSRLQKGEIIQTADKVFKPEMVLGEPRRGIKVTYCTDTRPLPVIAKMAKDADLFICEGMYGEKDKEKKAREYKHMTFYEAATLAKEANPKELWFTHYSPSLVKPEEYMKEVKEIFDRAIAAKDGRSLVITFDEE